MTFDKEHLVSKIKEKTKIQYHDKILKEGKKIKAEWMTNPQKPENLVGDIFDELLTLLKIPNESIITQTRVERYDLFKEKRYRYPDYQLVKHRRSEKNLYIELEPYNTDIEIGVKQAKEWISDITIGTVANAMAINLNKFILIYFDGKKVREKELSVEEACSYFSEIVFGKELSIKLDEINKITDQFYNQFSAIIHSGTYTSIINEKITILPENSIFENLLYSDKLNEMEKIEFIYTIFNRLIFIKILVDWNLFPEIFSYLRKVPHHLIHTELNNLFFRTLSVRKENRVNLPKAYDNIPFLNGGLFRITVVEKDNPNIMIDPNYLLIIFNFLEEYTFMENGANRSSINSEVLGYIFEKTIEFRKGTGSYYTHAIICDFMCESVLYPHLIARMNDYLKAIGYKEGELLENFEEIFMLKETTLNNLYEKVIINLKVCDICVGSGAFLLAMGNLLLEIHERILTILHKKVDKTKLKQNIVESNLFGVDLILSAIQICQLRLWLWISEGSKELKPLPNIEYNLRVGNTLLGSTTTINIQSINYKFIKKIKKATFLDESIPEYKEIIKEFEKMTVSFQSLKKLKTLLLDLYVYSHDTNTILLKELIEDLNELIVDSADILYLEVFKKDVKKIKLKNEVTHDFLRNLKTFHWYIEFPQVFPKGFDIIVGNPPYISTKFLTKIPLEQDIQALTKELNKKKKKVKKLKSNDYIEKYQNKIRSLKEEIITKNKLLQTEPYQKEILYNKIYKEFLKNHYKWAFKIYDILIPFFERGFELLKNNKKTYLSFITSNKFLATDYGELIRKDFLNDFQIEIIVDISMIKVFKDAAVYPIIISIKKCEPIEHWKVAIGRYKDINKLGNSLYFVEQERYNKIDTKFLIYIPLHMESYVLFDKIYSHLKCTTVGEEFLNSYREFDFTSWGDYEIFVKDQPGENLGDDYFLYVTNNDISPFKIDTERLLYFHKSVSKKTNPKNLIIDNEKWNIFSSELLLIKEVALDLICALGKNYANIGKIYALRLKEDSEFGNISNLYFLALFNSTLLDFYFRVIFWNTHLSGGYLNYHFSYLSILPLLKIEPTSIELKRIVFLSHCLTIQSNEIIKLLLNYLIINAYFPDEFLIPISIIDVIDENISKHRNGNIINKFFEKLEGIKREILALESHKIYQTINKERKFKET